MKKIILLSLILICGFILIQCNEKVQDPSIGGLNGLEATSDQSIRVMTFNIRLNTADDGDNAWPYRKDKAASMIRFYKSDIVGVQEAKKDQMDDLTELLPEFGWFGVGRDDGKDAGEFMSVFYRKDRFEVLEESTFWLSATPDSVSKGWDAWCYRIVTWGKFKDKKTDKEFYLFNTHFDHRGEVARMESAKLLLERVATIAGTSPVIVTGDFNSAPLSVPHRIITEGMWIDTSKKLVDAKGISKYPHHGPNGTITQFVSANLPHNKTIDYIFIKNDVSVLMHGTLSDIFDGRFPSDHMPVLAEVTVE
jgi:endonuclease/exonuclease/phosphatase family metal-dependent hydrolase